MAELTKKDRQIVEERTIKAMEIIDKSGINAEYYRKLFASLSDTEFMNLMKKKFPLKFHQRPGTTEPTIDDIKNALASFTNVTLFEKITLPYFYQNSEGVSVSTKPCLVGYTHIKKVQQMVVKKIKNSLEIDNRDMKTGRLNGEDKGAAMTDREFESLASLGFTHTIDEYSRFRADAMDAKAEAYNVIRLTGTLSKQDIPVRIDDPLSKQLMNVYMLGAHINSNLINQGYYTMYTLKNKQKNISRT